MVNYHEGDPTTPGNAALEPHELKAFEIGDATTVASIGRKHGAFCTEYALRNGGEVADTGLGAKALTRQPEQTLTSFKMGIPFTEGVMEGARNKIDDIVYTAENPQLARLAEGMEKLSEFGKLPEVQAVLAQQERSAYNNLMLALQDIKGTAQ
jgi:hypothetical protein